MTDSVLLWLPHEAEGMLIAEARRQYPMETGGVLLGYWSNTPLEAVVTCVLGPGPNALHERYHFEPDHPFQLREIERIYRESGRIASYLGDWHVHPDGSPTLSKLDMHTLRHILADPGARAPRPIMLIVGGAQESPDIAAYVLLRRSFLRFHRFQYQRATVRKYL